MPINNWASDLVKNGAIGTVHTVIAPNFVGPDEWASLPAEPIPQGGSRGWWDVWTNQAELRQYMGGRYLCQLQLFFLVWGLLDSAFSEEETIKLARK